VSSVSLIAVELRFPPTTSSTAMKLAPKRIFAPFLISFDQGQLNCYFPAVKLLFCKGCAGLPLLNVVESRPILTMLVDPTLAQQQNNILKCLETVLARVLSWRINNVAL